MYNNDSYNWNGNQGQESFDKGSYEHPVQDNPVKKPKKNKNNSMMKKAGMLVDRKSVV